MSLFLNDLAFELMFAVKVICEFPLISLFFLKSSLYEQAFNQTKLTKHGQSMDTTAELHGKSEERSYSRVVLMV